MTYAARETSGSGGAPVELYDFLLEPEHFRYTSADAPQVLDGQAFAPEAIERTEVDQSQEARAGSLTVTLPKANPVAAAFLPNLPAQPVQLTIRRLHRGDPDVVQVFSGQVASFSIEGQEAKLLCVPLTNTLKNKVPAQVYQSACNLMLYEPRCGVDPAAFTLEGTLTEIGADFLRCPAFTGKPDQWLTNGWIQWGLERRMILAHQGDKATLMSQFAGIQPGQAVKAVAGCARTKADCRDKFANLVNYFGFTDIPGRNPFQGGL